jgi:Concanavalin A-like lectin/glucanases superfamily
MHPSARKFAMLAFLAVAAVALIGARPLSGRAILLAERVTGGQLDLPWLNGLGISNNLKPLTLDPGHPAYDNPSGDHTVGDATTSMAPDSGGVIVTATDPGGISDYSWEAWVFTGDGNSRRGLIVRADPNAQFATNYQFVMQQGMAQFAFRRLAGQGPATTLRSWFAGDFPGGVPQVNTWHHMAILAQGSSFRCFWDGFEVTTIGGLGPIVDGTLTSGWVGVYNFRFDVGNIPFYVDDLLLDTEGPTPVESVSWGQVKTRWR